MQPWVDDSNAALFTDLYELTMLQCYFDGGMNEVAVFDLFMSTDVEGPDGVPGGISDRGS